MYMSLKLTNECLTTHLTYFDEAYMSSIQRNLPPMAITLQQKGYHTDPSHNIQTMLPTQ